MIDLYFWTTPNGYKPLILLEELGLPYHLRPVDLGRAQQFGEAFSKISPNHRIPAIVDHEPAEGPWSVYLNRKNAPVSLFESGAILLYLAEKTGRFYPADNAGRAEVLQWLFWQMAGLGPIAGQNLHFSHSAPKELPYAVDRYVRETERLFGVLEQRLREREFIAGDYSIVDMACYPWISLFSPLSIPIDDYPLVKTWRQKLEQRPAIVRAYAVGAGVRQAALSSDGLERDELVSVSRAVA
ncbi:MAG TPA: thiol:disulfide oxidoreductase [Porticoccaceae bacterium]|nr:thiol:disulfide oxidoreductase [Porticoccaceae bacterium]